MTISKDHTRLLKFLIVSALILIARPTRDSGRTLSENDVDIFNFSGKTITCAIELGDDMKYSHGLESGFSYEVMKDFARDHNCNIKIVVGRKGVSYVDSLMLGTIDLLVMHTEDAADNENLLLSENILDCSAIAMNTGKEAHVSEIDEWLETYVLSDEYKEKKNRFFRAFNPIKRAQRGVRSRIISPYDDLFKKYAKELGWDWRLVAAVVYQESKFSISSRSHRGASGLMQVMPKTGAIYGITDLTDPEQNLIAGTKHLKRLQGLYRRSKMTKEERIRFTLAAYNAGEGRIKDCRSLARSKGLDANVWANIVKVMPLMKSKEILDEDNIRLGKFNGKETVEYVDKVMDLYQAICKICPR